MDCSWTKKDLINKKRPYFGDDFQLEEKGLHVFLIFITKTGVWLKSDSQGSDSRFNINKETTR